MSIVRRPCPPSTAFVLLDREQATQRSGYVLSTSLQIAFMLSQTWLER